MSPKTRDHVARMSDTTDGYATYRGWVDAHGKLPLASSWESSPEGVLEFWRTLEKSIRASHACLAACRAALPLVEVEAERRRDSGVPGYETEMDELAAQLRAALAKAGEAGAGDA